MKVIKYLIKICGAGLVAFLLLCLGFTFYDLLPVHVDNKLGNTDYVWQPNSHWIKLTEGISWGKIDDNGFNNLEIVENPDILILGSSHMEAMNVRQDKSTAYLLQKNFENGKKVYNMGISGHRLPKILKYLPLTLQVYENVPETIIIETSSLTVSSQEIQSILDDHIIPVSNHSGIIAFLQKMPFLRVVYHQLAGGLDNVLFPHKESHVELNYEDGRKFVEVSEKQYDSMFKYIQMLQNKYGTNFLIVYHPMEELQDDGSVMFCQDENTELFESKCLEYGIEFLDMTNAFYDMYDKECKLPHGFITGEIGKGHLNENGHKVMAEELYVLISKRKDGES